MRNLYHQLQDCSEFTSVQTGDVIIGSSMCDTKGPSRKYLRERPVIVSYNSGHNPTPTKWMCAAKLLDLCKKCLGQDKKKTTTNTHTSGSSLSAPTTPHMHYRDITRDHRHQQKPFNHVVYVPGPSQAHDQIERELAMQRERHTRMCAAQRDMDLNLPPSIPISEDGEEGYIQSQRNLQMSCDLSREANRELVCPPPNRTIFDGESPPPYRSSSLGLLEGHKGPGPTRLVRDSNGSPVVVRCYSMSTGSPMSRPRDGRVVPPPTVVVGGGGGRSRRCLSAGHSRHSSSSDGGSSRQSPTLPPPPDYSDVMGNVDSVFQPPPPLNNNNSLSLATCPPYPHQNNTNSQRHGGMDV